MKVGLRATVVVRLEGFEPPTCCSGGNRSIHLSYRRTLFAVYPADPLWSRCDRAVTPAFGGPAVRNIRHSWNPFSYGHGFGRGDAPACPPFRRAGAPCPARRDDWADTWVCPCGKSLPAAAYDDHRSHRRRPFPPAAGLAATHRQPLCGNAVGAHGRAPTP